MIKGKNNLNIIIISLFIIIIGLLVYVYIIDKDTGNNKEEIIAEYNITKSGTILKEDKEEESTEEDTIILEKSPLKLIEGDFLSDNNITDKELEYMKHNTNYLQELVNNASLGSIIKLPSGTYYFASSGSNSSGTEDYVIKLKSNISIIGNGTDNNATILKPYSREGEIKYGLDMFYFNEFRDSGFTNPEYLINTNFKDFIIDSENTRGSTYNTSGKGFMINLCKNCNWDNIVVKNTDGTGFGMDNVINSTIKNSKAINCGKNANKDSNGGSGFGIGTGYSNEESMHIENCEAIGNTKYGFFFEHQGRFSKLYNASKSNGFVVSNSISRDNLYNFGGERSNDVKYIDCRSYKNKYTILDTYFTDDSRRCYISNMQIDTIFEDVPSDNKKYYDSIYWALSNSITNGVSKNMFGFGMYTKRLEGVSLLWRMTGREGNVLSDSELQTNRRNINIDTGFSDVPKDTWYTNAIKWAVDNNIVNGTTKDKFNPKDYITRAQFITMLWRYAGKPITNNRLSLTDLKEDNYYYEAIKWAYENNIIEEKEPGIIAPNDYCLREEIVLMLYRYQKIK